MEYSFRMALNAALNLHDYLEGHPEWMGKEEYLVKHWLEDSEWVPPPIEKDVESFKNKIYKFVEENRQYSPKLLPADNPELMTIGYIAYYEKDEKEVAIYSQVFLRDFKAGFTGPYNIDKEFEKSIPGYKSCRLNPDEQILVPDFTIGKSGDDVKTMGNRYRD